MASDPREDILARLVAVIASAVGSGNVSRNETHADDADGAPVKRIIVLEGEEAVAEGEGHRAAGAGRRIHMQPQVLLSNYDSSSEVGTGLSAIRRAIIKAVAADSELIALTYNNTGGRYMGMGDTEPAFAADVLGRMALRFQFTYELIPADLP